MKFIKLAIKRKGSINIGHKTQVDAEDYTSLNQWYWHLQSGYAIRSSGKKPYTNILMHREIMRPKKGQMVDHINGDKLDNRKSNLRLCSNRENMRNIPVRPHSSIYKGVSWRTDRNKWIAQITLDYKTNNLGYFKNERHAAMVYDIWAKEIFGEFAKLNFMEEK